MKGTPTDFWGKLELNDGVVVEWHPLLDHCADVAACCEALLQETLLKRRLATLAGLDDLSDLQISRLCVLAALHDLGKFSLGFQNKARARPPFVCGHLKEFLALFEYQTFQARLSEALPFEQFETWGESFDALLVATISHHGRPVAIGAQIPEKYWKADGELDPFEGMSRLIQQIQEWFPEAWIKGGEPLPQATRFQHAWSGLVMLADWIGSDSEHFFPFGDDLSGGRMPFSRAQAHKAIDQIGLAVNRFRSALGNETPGFEAIAPDKSPRPVQKEMMKQRPVEAGTIAVLEAETGVGKTEAALAYFISLFYAGLVDGLYFALPTRTAATQIYSRICQAVRNAFSQPEQRPSVLLAVPGYLEVDGISGRRLSRFQVLWNDDPHERYRYRGWAAEHAKRYLAGTIAVGTIDQVLLSSLKVSHSHLRATALLRQLLVVDEVHASDAYMTHVLEAVLEQHLKAGGHALLMSATLGSEARRRLLSTTEGGPPLQAATWRQAERTPYPMISFKSRGGMLREIPVAAPIVQKEVELRLCSEIDDAGRIVESAVEAAMKGARVLILRNTVSDCIDVQLVLESLPDQRKELLFCCQGFTAPHHSRFSKPDREQLDKAIESAFGKNRPTGGCVAVGTQTLQQSLDLDADFMMTDLCPIDVLLQRVGRLHRHHRQRPQEYEKAQVSVLIPNDPLVDSIRKSGNISGQHGLGSVYQDLRVVEATLRLLSATPHWTLPEDNRRLVEAATHPEALQELVESNTDLWEKHHELVIGMELAKRMHGRMNLVRRDTAFTENILFPSRDEAKIPTRLGESDRLVRFEQPPPSLFNPGKKITEMTIPFHLVGTHTSTSEETAADVLLLDQGFRFSFGPRRFLYDHLGLRVFEEES